MRRKKDPIETALAELSALRREADSEVVAARLREALASRHNLVVARAAKLVGELGAGELEAELIAAFERLMTDPAKLDSGGHGLRAIVIALLKLEIDAPRVFERGIRHVQPEPAYGGPVDVAVELRANSAIGLSACGGPDTVVDLVPLLVDKAEMVRIAAARAIGACGRLDAEPVLRLKLLVGDDEPEVIVECLAGLLRLAPERSLDLAETQLRDTDPARRQAAVLALGESRLEAGAELLIHHWPREIDHEIRRLMPLALVTSRREVAFDFLFGLVAGSHLGDAVEAIDALAVLVADPKIEKRLRASIAQSRYRSDLEQHLRKALTQS
ncbi:MAG: HEAT repeat domain-containing protein [bacterium]|nr:HEAT repeat domain-containing protein [bacterium]